MKSSGLRHKTLLFIGITILAVLAGSARVLLADSNMIQVIPGQAAAGVQASYGVCPCFRWSVRVQAAGGHWENRDFLISSDALFRFQQTENLNWARFASRMITVGAVNALWKGGHIGLGFNGVTFGEDRDRGYSDIIRTGLYALINVILTDSDRLARSARLDIRTGYDFNQMRVNLGPQIRQDIVSTAAVFQWNSGAWSGSVNAHIGMDMDHGPLAPSNLEYGGAATVHARVLSVSDLQLGLGLEVSADHDPFRELAGLTPDEVNAGLYMDLSWVDTLQH